MMEARIPFSGFYNSIWSSELDREEEQYAEHLAEKHEVPVGEVTELLFRHAKHCDAYREVAQKYVPQFEAHINEGLGLSIKLTGGEMTSPREYNFETDKIFVGISYRDALILARSVGRNALRKAAKEMFTSRSGFISFYRNDPAEWGRLRGWDHNQLYCLMQAAVDVIDGEDFEWGLAEGMSGNGVFGEAFHGAVDHEELMLGIGELIGKREAEEEAEENDDGRRFPVAYADTADYVKRYHEMNAKKYGGGL